MTSASTSDNLYTVIVCRRGDEFLMVHHPNRGWELPGGKLEDGEGPVHCALREFREETKHLLSQPKFVMKLEKDNGTCYVFSGMMGSPATGTVEDEAVDDIQWFSELPDELAFPYDPYDEIGEALDMKFR